MEEEVDSLAHFVVQSYRSSDVTNVIVCTIVMSVMVFYVFSYILIGVLERRRLPKVGNIKYMTHFLEAK